MSSNEEEASSPVTGASNSKEQSPPLPSDSELTQDELPEKKSRQPYMRPRIQWQEVLRFSKGDDAIIEEDEMKLQILQAHNKIMEDSRFVQSPGHMPGLTDVRMWKLKSEFTIDGG